MDKEKWFGKCRRLVSENSDGQETKINIKLGIIPTVAIVVLIAWGIWALVN